MKDIKQNENEELDKVCASSVDKEYPFQDGNESPHFYIVQEKIEK